MRRMILVPVLVTVALLVPAVPAASGEEVSGLIEAVEALVASGDLTAGQGQALIAKLEGAQASVDEGRERAALGKLNAFINQVEDLEAEGILDPSAAEELIAGAREVRNDVGCTDPLGCVTYGPEEPITLATALVIDGPIRFLGIGQLQGVELAVSLQGELLGRPVELRAEDSGCNPEDGEAAANAIVADATVAAVVGTTCSGAAAAAAPIISDAGYSMVSPSNTAPFLTDPATHEAGYLRVAWNDKDNAAVMAGFVRDQGAATSAVIFQESSGGTTGGAGYSETLALAFIDAFEALGGTNLALEEAEPDGAGVAAALGAIIAAGPPDVLYMPVFMPLGAVIATQARDLPELDSTALATADGLFFPGLIDILGADAEGMLFGAPDLSFTESPEYADFAAAYEAAFGEPPITAFDVLAYDAANVVMAAAEEAAAAEESTVRIGREALRDALFATTGFEGVSGTITCDDFGECADIGFNVWQVQGGEFVLVP